MGGEWVFLQVPGEIEDTEGDVVFGEEGQRHFEFQFRGDQLLVTVVFRDVAPGLLSAHPSLTLVARAADRVKFNSTGGESRAFVVIQDQVTPLEPLRVQCRTGMTPHLVQTLRFPDVYFNAKKSPSAMGKTGNIPDIVQPPEDLVKSKIFEITQFPYEDDGPDPEH